VEFSQVVAEIFKIIVIQDGGFAAILDLVLRLKLILNISMASLRRPAQFGPNRSSRARDIKDFSKSKMAAVPPFWI